MDERFAGKFDEISTLFRNCKKESMHYIIRKKTNLLQRNAETMTLSQGTDRLVFSKDLRERTLLINGSAMPIIH